ncbi:glycosyltransferase family A protein [Actinosynnema sp. NPDC051121]
MGGELTGGLRCTVIVPTYNRRRLLGLTLDSLARQDLPRDRFEVLVVDDGSSDDTAAVVRGFEDRLDLRYFYQPDEGYRVARARNVGIRHATGEISVFVDSGVLLHSASLSAHVGAHAASPEPLALNGYVYCFNLGNEDAGLINEFVDADDVDASIGAMARARAWPGHDHSGETRHRILTSSLAVDRSVGRRRRTHRPNRTHRPADRPLADGGCATQHCGSRKTFRQCPRTGPR